MDKKLIESERLEIYNAIKNSIEIGMKQEYPTDYCYSWWINTRNYDWKVSMPSSKINRRLELLVKHGFLKAESQKCGIKYKLTAKVFTGNLTQ